MRAGFTDAVAAVLRDTGTDPTQLTLEITESVFVEDVERAVVVLEGLKRLGVTLALDDFGTGYSSLSYLQRFPIDVVKIDQQFIGQLSHPPSSMIVLAVVQIAHVLGLSVVAEGVETAKHHVQVQGLGCDSAQGFYFARPIAAGEIDAMIQHRQVGGALPLTAPGTGSAVFERVRAETQDLRRLSRSRPCAEKPG
jgi:EAL domain-containing protein (putative c-di-GMP-specific phosphodiesterase class I)